MGDGQSTVSRYVSVSRWYKEGALVAHLEVEALTVLEEGAQVAQVHLAQLQQLLSLRLRQPQHLRHPHQTCQPLRSPCMECTAWQIGCPRVLGRGTLTEGTECSTWGQQVQALGECKAQRMTALLGTNNE